LRKVSGKLNTKASTMILLIITLTLIFSLVTIQLAKILVILIGMIYPSYMTFKVLPPNPGHQRQQ
jgi:hypothetical protein